MGTTSPDNIRFPDGLFPVNISADLENLAEDVQSALLKSARSGTSTQRTAATSLISEGGLWQDTDGIRMIWRKQGASWVPAVWRWAGTTAQMNGFTQAPNGFEWYNTSTQISYIRRSGSWVAGATPFAQAAGSATSASSGTVTVTYPAGKFTHPPMLTATKITGGNVGVVHVVSPTATGFSMSVWTLSGSQLAVAINWHAIQMLSTSGAG